MNIVTSGSRSALSKTFNHVLYRCKLTKNMFDRTHAYITCRQSIIISFSADDEIVNSGDFAKSIVYERECPQLLSTAELEDILNFICTD